LTIAMHEKMRNTLKGFYGVLKSSDEHLKFVFFTGIMNCLKITCTDYYFFCGDIV
jgi:hypothetical protein